VFYKKQCTYNPQMTHGHRRKVAKTNYIKESNGNSCYGREVRNTFYDSTDRYPLDVQVFSNGNQMHKYHPTEKPVELLEYLVKTYTNTGDVVLDACMGSGTTGVAAVNLSRRFIGIELDKDYYNISKERIESVANQKND
jgi:site-specific DNA-methyltransferase (adenine-specific)